MAPDLVPRARIGQHAWLVSLAVGALALVVLAALIVGSSPRRSTSAGRQLGSLAYALDRDVFLADPDGRHASRITHADGGPFGYGSPRFSPDGRLLTYERRGAAAGETTTFVADATGIVLASFPGHRSAWAPDSTRIATWSGGDAVPSIDVHDIEGILLARLPLPGDAIPDGDSFVTWTADGLAAAVELRRPGSGVETWVLPVDGTAPRSSPLGSRDWLVGAASPDGSRVAFLVRGQRRVTVVRAGDDPRPLVALSTDTRSGVAGGIRWSPGGDRIAYGSADGLRVVDADYLVTSPRFETTVAVGAVAWSPDAARILFAVGVGGDASGLDLVWRVDADGSDPVRLVDGTTDADWQWLPD